MRSPLRHRPRSPQPPRPRRRSRASAGCGGGRGAQAGGPGGQARGRSARAEADRAGVAGPQPPAGVRGAQVPERRRADAPVDGVLEPDGLEQVSQGKDTMTSASALRVLAVDDNSSLLRFLVSAFTASGCAVTAAPTAEEALDPQAFMEQTLRLATESLKNDGGLLLLRDEHGHFTSAQTGAPAVVSELLGLLQLGFDRVVATGGREAVALTRPGHRLDVVAAAIPGVDRCMGVVCLARLSVNGGFLPDERDMLLGFAQTTAVALQKLVLRESLERHLVDTITAFVNAIESKDPYLKGHSARVALYAVEIASRMGLDDETVQIVSRGAMLHDLGKLSIMDTILRKPDRLTDEEFAIIKAHPVVGERILKPLTFLHRESCAVRSHHERFDGTGYPDGLKGEDIPLVARIVTVADVFDAVTSNRPYRTALPVEAAREEIARGRGTHFDPQVADAFASIPLERLVEITRHYESLVSAPLRTGEGELARAS